MEDMDFINQMKLRFSFGIVGVKQVVHLALLILEQVTTEILVNTMAITLAMTFLNSDQEREASVGNSDVTWETRKTKLWH